ncbi:MAG: hypothetical protein ACK5MQ_12915 [Pikeienuella sp.]
MIRRVFGPDVELIIIPPPKNATPGEHPGRNAHSGMIADPPEWLDWITAFETNPPPSGYR